MSSLAPWLDARGRIQAAAVLPADATEWPNEPFTQPAGGVWMSVRDVGELYEPLELGGRYWQERGRLLIEVFAEAGTGTVALRQTAEAVANIFRGLGPNPVVYLGGSIGSGYLADAGDGAWWCLPVTIEWRYDTSLATQ